MVHRRLCCQDKDTQDVDATHVWPMLGLAWGQGAMHLCAFLRDLAGSGSVLLLVSGPVPGMRGWQGTTPAAFLEVSRELQGDRPSRAKLPCKRKRYGVS